MSNLSMSHTIRAWLLAPVVEELQKLRHEQKTEIGKVVLKVSELSDKIDALGTGLDDVSTKLATLGTDLSAEIQEINDKLAAGSATPEDLAKLSALSERLTAMSTQVSGLSDTVKGIVTP